MAYKHNYDKILTRLTTILSRLNEGETLSVKELAEEFNTSTRTIQRDFNERLKDFHIFQENKKWKMKADYKVEKIKSLEDEIVLDIMEKMTEDIGGSFYTKAHTLLSKIKNEDFNPIYTKLNIEDISEKFQDIQILEYAIKKKREVESIYNNEQHKPYKTILQPLKIVNYEGFWYLIALQKDILKKYYLKNISHPKILETTFTTDTKLDTLLKESISVWFQKDVEPFEVKLFAQKHAAKYFKRRPLQTQRVDSLFPDGSMEFTIKITHKMEILPIIKYWIPHLLIVEPQWINKIIKKDLEVYISKIP
jgi:predicted DNA-binding transcriptional regulator YafY